MKRIGIITFFHDNNVGTCLQAYALQHTIRELGYSAEIINYKHSDVRKSVEGSLLARIYATAKTYGNKYSLYYRRFKETDKLIDQKFNDFRDKYYVLSKKEYIRFDELKEDDSNFDLYVCGSDMIWTPSFNIDHRIFFLQFCDMSKRIAYAPSFGCSSIEKKYESDYKKYISEMNYISCRELSGVELIANQFKKKAKFVLDPTQLLSSGKWIEVCLLKNIHNKYIFSYIFPDRNSNWHKKIADRAAAYLSSDVRYMPMNRKEMFLEWQYGDAAYGPLEFLTLMYNAEFIITNSYHGLMFAIIFHKPFVLLRRDGEIYWNQFESRMESILNILGEDKRYLRVDETLNTDLCQLNYDKLDNILSAHKNNSIEYLKSSLQLKKG